jgi:hypothetical protein
MNNFFIKTLIWLSLAASLSTHAAPEVSTLSNSQFTELQILFKQLISTKTPPSKAQWSLAGISMTENEQTITLQADNKKLFSIGEAVIKKQRDLSTSPLMLQAPHQFYDLHTGKLANNLFKDDKYHIKMLNSAQRYSSKHADLAHQTLSIFSAFAEVFTQENIQAKIVQLHGYTAKKRKTNAGRYADVIISNGTKYPDNSLRELQVCHRTELGLVTRIYGYDVFELGATTNKIGIRLNKNQEGQFIHIELSKDTREKFEDTEWLRSFSKCL